MPGKIFSKSKYAKIKNNKEVAGASRFADKCAMNKETDKVGG